MYEKVRYTVLSANRGGRRFVVIGLLIALVLGASIIAYSPSLSSTPNTCVKPVAHAAAFEAEQISVSKQFTFMDMNNLKATANAKKNKEQVLILTPLKNATPYLIKYFELIDKLTYPKHLISVAFLVSDTTDDTVQMLREYAEIFANHEDPNDRFHKFTIYQRDFNFELQEEVRHKYELQPLRRKMMARSRNYLLTAALREEHAWVLWLDVDVVEYEPMILEDMISVDVDVLVPNCLLKRPDGEFWGYDKNNWQETNASIAIQEKIKNPEFVLLEGYYEFETKRRLMIDMETHLGKLKKEPLDGVGGTFTLVKAHVHREGANFPAFTYKHQVETEGFAKMAKAMGFGVYGLPGYIIYHVVTSTEKNL